MQERTALSGMDLKAYLGRLKQNPKYTEEILKLIEDDLRFGLTKEETEEYSAGRYDYRQMCVYSRCLRNGYNEEEKAAILKEGLNGDQMAVALEFYEKRRSDEYHNRSAFQCGKYGVYHETPFFTGALQGKGGRAGERAGCGVCKGTYAADP